MGVITGFNPANPNNRNRQNMSPLDELMAQAESNAQAQQQAVQIQGAQGGQAIGGVMAPGVSPGGVRGGEGPPLPAVRGAEGGPLNAVNTSMPTLDIWNGNTGVRHSASGAPATPLDAMRGMGGIDPGYLPNATGAVTTGAPPVPGNQDAMSILNSLEQRTVNSLPDGRLNPNFASALANANRELGPILSNNLGQDTLGLNRTMQLGTVGPNGAPIPGAIANNATQAYAQLLQAQNAPRAEDVAGDMGAERRIEQLRASGMSEETAAGVMRRAGERLPRRLGGTGGNVQSGNSATPPWQSGPLANTPAGTAPSGAASNSPGPAAPQPSRAIDQAFEIGNQIIPTTPGANGQMSRVPYGENSDAYHNAITQVLQNIPDDQLRNNFPEIQRRLAEQFGGSQALDTWLNQMTSPVSRFFSGQGTRDRQAQIRRVLGLANMRQSPISLHSRGLTTPQVIGAALTSPSLGQ